MSWTAVITAGGAILGGVIGAQGSKSAAKTQAGGAEAASQAQLGMFNQTRENLYPWMQTGKTDLLKLNELAGFMSDGSYNPNAPLVKPFGMEDFKASPAYNFNLEQGKLAIDKASAARGKFYAPTTLQEIAKYSQGLASNEFQNSYNNYNTNLRNIWDRLYSLSASGQNAAAQLGGFGTTVGGQVGGNIIGGANAAAAGQVGSANALTGSLSNLANNYMMQQLLSNNQQSSVGNNSGPMQYIEMPQS